MQMRRHAREMTEEKCRKDLLVTFKYHKDAPGVFESDEFLYKSNMYDVKKREIFGDSVRITCMNDTREKSLMESYFKQMNGSGKNTFPGSKTNAKWQLNKMFFNQPENESLNVCFNYYCIIDLKNYLILNPIINILDPPPEA
ncbi:MAG: hypothetical protein V2A54_07160 [Bacteroidota bacterium]